MFCFSFVAFSLSLMSFRARFFCFMANLCNFPLSPSVKAKELYKSNG